MHPRFARARRAELRWPDGAIEVVLAEGFRLRLMGLMHLGAEEIEPLLFERCRSIHTHGMRTPIDLVWLESDGEHARVLEVADGLEPGRLARAPRNGSPKGSIAALELTPGEAERSGLSPGLEVSLAADQPGVRASAMPPKP